MFTAVDEFSDQAWFFGPMEGPEANGFLDNASEGLLPFRPRLPPKNSTIRFLFQEGNFSSSSVQKCTYPASLQEAIPNPFSGQNTHRASPWIQSRLLPILMFFVGAFLVRLNTGSSAPIKTTRYYIHFNGKDELPIHSRVNVTKSGGLSCRFYGTSYETHGISILWLLSSFLSLVTTIPSFLRPFSLLGSFSIHAPEPFWSKTRF
jgi:hypothetical protein